MRQGRNVMPALRHSFADLASLRNHAAALDRAEEIKPFWYGEAKDQQVPGWKGIYNVDKGKFVTAVDSDYNIIQHRELVVEATTAMSNLGLQGTAKVGDSGNVVFVDITFPGTKLGVAQGEEFFAGLRLINSYNKGTGIIIAPRYERLVCSNGMTMPSRMIQSFSVKHTSKLAQEFAAAIPVILKEMIEFEPRLKALVEEGIADSIEYSLMKQILASMVTADKHMEAIEALLPANPTRWDLYNAFTHYATHDQQIKPTMEQRLLTKAQVLLDTPLAQLVPPQVVQ